MICIFNLAKIVRVIDLPDTMFSIYLGLGLACDGSVAGFCANHPQYPLIFPVSCTDMSCLEIYACRLQVSQAYGTICQSMVTLRVLLWSKHQYCELFKAFPYLSKLNSRKNQRSSLGFITMCQACFDTKRNVESKAQLHFTFSWHAIEQQISQSFFLYLLNYSDFTKPGFCGTWCGVKQNE